MTEDLFRHLRAHVGNKKMDEKIMAKEMKELDERQQLLVITMEECGELIQECSKNLRRSEIFDRQKFKDEVGDVYAMIELLVEWDVLSWDEIENRRDEKRKKLSKWSDLIGESETELYEKEEDTGWRKALGDTPKDENGIGRVTYERVKKDD